MGRVYPKLAAAFDASFTTKLGRHRRGENVVRAYLKLADALGASFLGTKQGMRRETYSWRRIP